MDDKWIQSTVNRSNDNSLSVWIYLISFKWWNNWSPSCLWLVRLAVQMLWYWFHIISWWAPAFFLVIKWAGIREPLCIRWWQKSHFLTVNMSFRERERVVSCTNIHAIGVFMDPCCCRIKFLAKCTLSVLEVNHGRSGDARQHKYGPLETVANLIRMRVVLTQPLQIQHLNKPWQLDKQMLQDRSFSLKQSKHGIFYDYINKI